MATSPAPRTAPVGALAVLATLATLAVIVSGVLVLARTGSSAPDPDAGPRLSPVADRSLRASRAEVRAAHLLEAWDERRAAAWARGDAAALGGLYVAGSAAGAHDRAMLAAWVGRGWCVRDLRTQVLDLRVVAHRPGRYDLEVVDRVVAGVAVAVSTGAEQPLPQDRPSTRRVVLVEQHGTWLVASVGAGPTAGPSAAPP